MKSCDSASIFMILRRGGRPYSILLNSETTSDETPLLVLDVEYYKWGSKETPLYLHIDLILASTEK